MQAVAIAGAALLVAACARKTVPDPEPAVAQLPPSESSFRGSSNGMEMMWWGVSTDSRQLADLLAPYLEDSTGLDTRVRSLWQANGFRVVAVPVDQLNAMQQLLPSVGGVQRQWLGQVPVWTDVIHGTPWRDLQAVDMDNGRLNLGPGRVRILLRCWTIPLPAVREDDVRAAMRTELLIQHQEPERVDPAALYQRPTDVSDPLEQGLVFTRLAASLTLSRDRAIVIIPESPDVDWRSLAQVPLDELPAPSFAESAALAERSTPPGPPDDPAGDTPGVGKVFRDRAAQRDPDEPVAEPPLPGPTDPGLSHSRTLGELTLTPNRTRLGAIAPATPRIRSILILVPRIPERFSLTAPTTPPSTPASTPPSTPAPVPTK